MSSGLPRARSALPFSTRISAMIFRSIGLRLGDSPSLLLKVAGTVCDHFAYKVDRRGRPEDKPLGVRQAAGANLRRVDRQAPYLRQGDLQLTGQRAGRTLRPWT